MHLGMSLARRAVRVQVQTQTFFKGSALPRFAALIETHSEVVEAAKHFAESTQFTCDEDCVLAAFVPDLRPQIAAYYAGRGPKLVEMDGPRGLERLDGLLCQHVAALVDKWRAFKRDAEQRLGSTRKAAAEFERTVMKGKAGDASRP